MEGKAFILLATLAVVFGSPISQTKPTDLLPALDAYVDWSDQVSGQFLVDVTSLQVRHLEETGSNVYDELIAAIQRTESELGVDIDTDETKKNLLKTLEAGLVQSVGTDKLVGLMIGASPLENHGARLAVSTQVFNRITLQLRERLDQLENGAEVDSEKLSEIVQLVMASEVAFDAMAANFKSVEDTVLIDGEETEAEPGQYDHEDVTADPNTEAEVEAADGILTRRKRQTRPINLGGGFSTNGRSVIWNRGRTTVRATPHFSLRPKPQFHGATAGFEHRFRNNRGSVYGSASVNNRGRFTGGHVGVRIRF